jgi:MFS family permease
MLLVQAGKIGDRYGKKRIYLLGFALFGIASALCGVTQNVTELIAFRVFQGASSALLAATAAPLVFESFPPNKRGYALAINSIAWSLGAIAGPVVGGVFVSISWRLIFYINVPITFVAVLIGRKRIPSSSPKETGAATGFGRIQINIVSSVLLAVTVVMMLLWLTFFDVRFALISVLFLGLLVLSEGLSKNPLLNKELRRNRGYVLSIIALAIVQVAFMGIAFAMSFYFQSVSGYPPLIAGLSLAPLPIALGVSTPFIGKLNDRMKAPVLLSFIGMFLQMVGTVALGYFIGLQQGSSSLYTVGICLSITGIGEAFVWSPLITTVLRFSKPELRGVANGTSFMLVNIAFAGSIAIVTAVSASLLPSNVVSQIFFGNLGTLNQSQAMLFSDGIARALITLGLINLLSIPFFLFVVREQRHRPVAVATPSPSSSK